MVAADQRRRLVNGTALALARYGFAAMTVEHVRAEANVSRTTFYKNFDNKRDCVLVAHEEAFDRLADELLRACANELEWPAKVAAGVSAVVGFAASRPEEALLLVVDALAGDPALVPRVLASHEFLVDLLRSGRDWSTRASQLPAVTEQALVGATSSVIGARLVSGQAESLRDLESQLIQLTLLPYVGAGEARRVAARLCLAGQPS